MKHTLLLMCFSSLLFGHCAVRMSRALMGIRAARTANPEAPPVGADSYMDTESPRQTQTHTHCSITQSSAQVKICLFYRLRNSSRLGEQT